MHVDTETEVLAAAGNKRIRAELPVKVYEGTVECFTGTMRDMSTSGFSAFLKPVPSDSNGEDVDYSSLTADEVREKLSGRKFYAVIDMEREIDPVAVRVTGAERSWRTDFAVLVVFSFDKLNENDRLAVSGYIAKRGTAEAKTEVIHLDRARPGSDGESLNGREDVHIVFRARYFYIAYMRDLCDKLAVEMGFGQEEVFELKLAMDEILTNALEHGCSHYGEDTIDVRMYFHEDGISVHVRDPGGKVFDDSKYRGNDDADLASMRSGLGLIDKFMDRWEVHTSPNQYTEVMFFKKKPGKEEE